MSDESFARQLLVIQAANQAMIDANLRMQEVQRQFLAAAQAGDGMRIDMLRELVHQCMDDVMDKTASLITLSKRLHA